MSPNPFIHALCVVAKVMEVGRATHPGENWMNYPVTFHVERALRHLQLLEDGDQGEDHLANSCCRLLMALSLRELEDHFGQ